MGWVNFGVVKPAGDYLLKLLNERGSVRYGKHFYDGTEELQERLEAAFGDKRAEGEEERQDCDPCIRIDFAVIQLEKTGLIETEFLTEELPDGEPDYRIALTPKGKAFVTSGQAFKYRDMDL